MQFKVPQFLEIEDKIFGPFTFRQFIYLVGGGGMCFVIYRILGFYLGIIPIAAIAGFAFMLAFYRPNDKPFIHMLEAGIKYFMQNKLYLWRKEKVKAKDKEVGVPAKPMYQSDVKLTKNKLRDLAWSLDVLDLKKENNN